LDQVEEVSGSSAAIILAGIALGIGIITNAEAIGDFFSGVFDGFGAATKAK
jgi:hypothetical protein